MCTRAAVVCEQVSCLVDIGSMKRREGQRSDDATAVVVLYVVRPSNTASSAGKKMPSIHEVRGTFKQTGVLLYDYIGYDDQTLILRC